MRTLLFVSFAALSCKSAHPSHHAHGRLPSFEDAEAWAAQFEDPKRELWQKPAEVIAALALPPEAKVADIGSATGYFAVRLAKALPQGRVFGVDVEASMVEYLNRRAEREQLTNVSSHLAEFADAKIPEPVDLILIVNTYHHIESRSAYFAKLAASLRSKGRIAIIDFTPASQMGPPVESKVPAQQVEAELKKAGYTLTQSHSFLPEQFFLIFERITAP